MPIIVMLLVSISLYAVSPSPLYEAGKKLYFAKGCNGCHGITAGGMNQYPPLAYRRKAFLENKLKGYRAKKASTQLAQMMIPFALALTDSQIEALTTFFSEYHENKNKEHYEPDDSNTGGGSS